MSENKQELQRKIEKMELRLAELKTRLAAVELAEQHEAVDHLDEYLQAVDHEYDSLRAFWPVVVQEFRTLLGKKP
ncbi:MULTISPECIES: hypothetical protein [unclassified Oceanobacter]|uniref:hypothetical protein n=1 Tax=unclassified Oceanobacter TaxID=2620260 RepID=UPI0026E3829E|nr:MULTISPECIES: hypothetical protein [unclassified Oceanobacter]MDO6683553.1 hypothetical protein [Oceanobacter sp. 5_MG-2023]MDP2504788.1 hypothetical protein [Oceanobacter sp. 3_MG-2023]MDP2546231.1 hypothetical protein [Oceanobacter sp. 4_MG-2023]MDP2607533.1 hypothetical protein [Oceanobacter sp. 1_MG-2023]MDP2610801.1 hypothetical protein [Oceanobacter sp. 2_MG-2023]